MRKLLALLTVYLLFAGQLLAQKSITGKVTDDKGNPIPNVSVMVKGMTSGTITKPDGTYSLTIPASAKVLVFSSVDMAPEEISIGSQTNINVSLKGTEKVLTEVVMTGYSREKRSQFSGAATVLSSKAVETVPVGAFDQAFQGRVPGLLANSGTGQPGSSANVHIRGYSSIGAAGVQPLYVLDGVPLAANDVATINPNDFESITVLKDAGAAALYGARGALGVIVITTKRGKAGQTNFTFRTQFGFTERPSPSKFNQMNSTEMLAYEELVGASPGNSALTAPGWYYSSINPANAGLPATSPANSPYSASKERYSAILDSFRHNNFDYYDILFRTGFTQTHEINMNGGAGTTRYYISLGQFNQEGTDRKSHLNRYTLRFNLDNTVGKLTTQLNAAVGYSITDFNEGAFYAGNGTANPFAMVWRAKPYENPWKPDGTLNYGTSGALAPKAIANLIERSDNSKWIDKQIKANAGLVLALNIIQPLTLRNVVGVDGSNDYGQGSINASSFAGSGQLYNSGYLNESMFNRLQLINTTSLVYSQVYGKHSVEVGGFFEAIRVWQNGLGFSMYNLDPRLTQTGQGAGTLTTTGVPIDQYSNSAKSGYGIRSYFGNARYIFDNKYTISGTIRRDGTSRIVKDENKEITTWAAGVSWEAMKENFMRGQNVLTDLRLRGTYGEVPNIGSIPGSTYGLGSNFFSVSQYHGAQIPQFTATAYPGSPLTGLSPSVANPDLRIETVEKINIGIDLGFWRNRVRLSVDAYKHLTNDLFVSQRLVATSGFYGSSLSVNAGTMSNKGLEFDLTADIVRSRDVDVTLKMNHSINKNKIEDLGSVTEYPAGTGIIKEGLPYGTHYSYWYLGADPATGRPQYKKADGSITTNISEAGQFHEFGTYIPVHVGGFSVDFRYQRIVLSAFFSYQFDVMRYNNIQNWVEQGDLTYAGAVTQSRRLLTEQWRRPGDVKIIQSPSYSRQFTSYDITDAKFLRFRNLNIAYNVPELKIGNVKLCRSARFYVQGQNLWIWSPWSGLDPEDDNNISLAEFPNPRAVVVGIDINF